MFYLQLYFNFENPIYLDKWKCIHWNVCVCVSELSLDDILCVFVSQRKRVVERCVRECVTNKVCVYVTNKVCVCVTNKVCVYVTNKVCVCVCHQ